MRSLLVAASIVLLAIPSARAAEAAPAPRSVPFTASFDVLYVSEARPVIVRLRIASACQSLTHAWEAFVAALFEKVDADKNGIIDEKEAKKLKALIALVKGPDPRNRFAQRFSNGMPGQPRPPAIKPMTRGELAEYLKQNELGPLRLPPPVVQQQQSQPNFSRGGKPSTADLNKAFMEQVDANKDGKLSASELDAGIAILLKLDTDENELVSMDELTRRPRTPFFVQETLDVSAGPMIELLPLARTGAEGATAKRLLVRYGPKPANGQNRNDIRQFNNFNRRGRMMVPQQSESTVRKLTRKDIKLEDALFARFDQDGDGELDAEELARLGQSAVPDVEFRLRFGRSERGAQVIEVIEPGTIPVKGAADPSGRSATIAMPGICLDFTVPRGLTLAEARAAFRDRYLDRFRTVDRDNNGYLSPDEGRNDALFGGEAFTLFDRDNDNNIYEREAIETVEELGDLMAAASAGVLAIDVHEVGHGLFGFLDADGDDGLSVRELRAMPRLLARFDSNHDGLLELKELPRRYEARMVPAGQSAPIENPQFNPFGIVEPTTPRPPGGPLWFRKMDRNRDGDVSRREFLGDAAAFRKLDSDGDGLISVEEAEAAAAK